MYVYLASSNAFRSMYIGKIGCSEELYGRRSTYLTGCPPGLTPSYDFEYEGVWETTAITKDELFDREKRSLKLIAGLNKRKAKFLDIGCGIGFQCPHANSYVIATGCVCSQSIPSNSGVFYPCGI